MIEWTLWVAITCAQPRLPFKQFFEQVHHGMTFPGRNYETVDTAMRRLADTVAGYTDYAEQYRDRCR